MTYDIRRNFEEGTPWTQEEILTLEAMWRAGDLTRTIAERLKRGRNSVIGKAHRLGLPTRPSPIRALRLERAGLRVVRDA